MDTATQEDNERVLIQQMQQGLQGAFHTAVRTYSPSMLAVARYYLDRDNADDVVQDSWVTVVDAIHKFEGRSVLKTWLNQIVANRAKNRLRSLNREVSTDFGEPLDPALERRFASNGRWAVPPTIKSTASADTLLESGALSDCLNKHLSRLPEYQRSALMLYEAHQHKSDNVCNILDVSASNLRVLLHRARQRIFLMVEHFQETGEC